PRVSRHRSRNSGRRTESRLRGHSAAAGRWLRHRRVRVRWAVSIQLRRADLETVVRPGWGISAERRGTDGSFSVTVLLQRDVSDSALACRPNTGKADPRFAHAITKSLAYTWWTLWTPGPTRRGSEGTISYERSVRVGWPKSSWPARPVALAPRSCSS